MSKILGLDLGTNSIGWAMINKTDKSGQIIDAGVRIFPEGVEAKTIGLGEKEQSKNATRRDARQMRRQYFRKKLRKAKLLHVLIEHNMCPLDKEKLQKWTDWEKSEGKAGRKFPSSPEFIKWLKMNPYKLRSKALKENITLEELGRILYHIIQRRGFLSSRKGKEEGKIFSGKDNMIGIDDTKKQIQDKTLGNYLHSILPAEDKPYNETPDAKRARARYTLRDMYVSEFHCIWEKQAQNLGLDDKKVEQKKVRFLKGGINSKRNKKKIEYLQDKYEKDNIKIEKVNKLHKVTTKTQVLLKEFLAGEIKEEVGSLKFKSNDSVLFYQRPLRSQKGLLAKCSLESRKFYDKKEKKWITVGSTPCPVSHPDFELKRAYEFINNIEYGAKQPLDDTQKQLVLDLINSKDCSFDFKEIPKKLNLTYEKFNYDNKYKVSGNYTIKHLKPLFIDVVWNKEHKITINKEEQIEYGYERIWHCFYFYDDAETLIKKLKDDYELKKEGEKKILGELKEGGSRKRSIILKDGYSNISLKAIRNILPYLEKGYKFSDAVLLGGVRNAFRTTKDKKQVDRWGYFKDSWEEIEENVIRINHEKDNKEGEAIEKIKEYLINNDYGFEKNDRAFQKLYHHSQETEKKKLQENLPEVENLRNPIVQQGLNEMKRLVNDLIEEHGNFDRINVELGRDLKNSKKKRQELTKRIEENRSKNDEARAKLTEYGLRHSRDNIQKYLLYKEIEDKAFGPATCPYTGQTMNIDDVLGEDRKIEIEHIIPKSISLDDSFANKTLCDAKFNGEKGELTPYKFYQINSDEKLWGVKSWDEVMQRAFKLLPYRKAKRFTAETDLKLDSFIERQKNDMRYMSRKAKELLSNICDDARAMPGGLTAELRHLWGVNNVLQHIRNVELPDIEIEKDKVYPYYLVVDEHNKQVAFKRIYNPKPSIKAKQTTLAGEIKKGVFSSTEKYTPYKEEVPDGTKEGEYWKLLNLSEPKEMVKVFREKPETGEDKIVLRGKVKKEKFRNDSIGFCVAKGIDDGFCWAAIPVKNKKLIKPTKEKQPKKKAKEILLYGEAKEGIFTSYIYQCSTNEEDGKYWLLLDLNFDAATFEIALNERPKVKEKQIAIQGAVNNNGNFSSDIDYQHQFHTDKETGKYWIVFDIVGNGQRYEPIKNEEPERNENQKLIEGNIWVDKYSGEIKFDPKKNREDQRHHAIDAIIIALSEQSYFQQLSTYYATKKKKDRGKEFDRKQMDFPEPWENFHNDIKKIADRILVSYKQNRKVLTEVRKKIIKNGKTIISRGMAVRGQLHEKTFYGENKHCRKDEYVYRVEIPDLSVLQIRNIVDEKVKRIIADTISISTAIKKDKSGKETPIKLYDEEHYIFNQLIKGEKLSKEEKKKEKAVKEKVSEMLKNLRFYIPNEGKRYQRLKKEDKGFEREQVPIKKVRVKKVIGNAELLKETQGMHIIKNEANDYNQYVEPGNNHHALIYRDEAGNLKEYIVTFWTAVERKRQGEAIFQLPEPLPGVPEPKEIIMILQINDMFLLKGRYDRDAEKGIIENIEIEKADYKTLSRYLYRVQWTSTSGYKILFRHHLASTIDNTKEMAGISSMKNWEEEKPQKVKITPTGKIEKL